MTLRVGWRDKKGRRQIRDYDDQLWWRLVRSVDRDPIIQDIWMVNDEGNDDEVLVYQQGKQNG